MVVWGLWLDDDAFYFSTGRNTRKARNLAANPSCVVCPGDAEEAVIVEGTVAEVADPASIERFCKAYQAKYAVDPSGMDEPIFVARPCVVYGQIEKTFTKSATHWQFGGLRQFAQGLAELLVALLAGRLHLGERLRGGGERPWSTRRCRARPPWP